MSGKQQPLEPHPVLTGEEWRRAAEEHMRREWWRIFSEKVMRRLEELDQQAPTDSHKLR